MSDPAAAPSPTAFPRDRSPEARQAARAKKAERERRIIGLFNRGVSVAEIAGRENLSLSRMRGLVREILARRAPQPPAEFVAAQVSRLNEALLASYDSMYNCESGANFKAIDRVVTIVRELDRYRGFECPPPRRKAESRDQPPPAESLLALQAPSAELFVHAEAPEERR